MSSRDDRQIPLPEPVERDDDYDDTFAPTRRLLRNFAALLAVGALAGIVWYAYQAGVSAGSAGDGQVPVIRAEAGPIKEKVDPAGAGGIDVPYRDRKVYGLLEESHAEAVKKTETVAPKRATETGGDGESEDDAAEAADTKPGGAEAATDKPADAKPAEAKAAEDKAAKEKAEDKQVAAAPPSGFRVQLAAVSSAEDASRQWQKIQNNNNDILGGAKLMVEKVELPAKKQTLYRIQAGPFKSAKEAQDVCAKLAARKVSCFFVKG